MAQSVLESLCAQGQDLVSHLCNLFNEIKSISSSTFPPPLITACYHLSLHLLRYHEKIEKFHNQLEQGVYVEESLAHLIQETDTSDITCKVICWKFLHLLLYHTTLPCSLRRQTLEWIQTTFPDLSPSTKKALESLLFVDSPDLSPVLFQRFQGPSQWQALVLSQFRRTDLHQPLLSESWPSPADRSIALLPHQTSLVISLVLSHLACPPCAHLPLIKSLLQDHTSSGLLSIIPLGYGTCLDLRSLPWVLPYLSPSPSPSAIQDTTSTWISNASQTSLALSSREIPTASSVAPLLSLFEKYFPLLRQANSLLRWGVFQVALSTPRSTFWSSWLSTPSSPVSTTPVLLELLLTSCTIEQKFAQWIPTYLATREALWTQTVAQCRTHLETLAQLFQTNSSFQEWCVARSTQLHPLQVTSHTSTGHILSQFLIAIDKVLVLDPIASSSVAQHHLMALKNDLSQLQRISRISPTKCEAFLECIQFSFAFHYLSHSTDVFASLQQRLIQTPKVCEQVPFLVHKLSDYKASQQPLWYQMQLEAWAHSIVQILPHTIIERVKESSEQERVLETVRQRIVWNESLMHIGYWSHGVLTMESTPANSRTILEKGLTKEIQIYLEALSKQLWDGNEWKKLETQMLQFCNVLYKIEECCGCDLHEIVDQAQQHIAQICWKNEQEQKVSWITQWYHRLRPDLSRCEYTKETGEFRKDTHIVWSTSHYRVLQGIGGHALLDVLEQIFKMYSLTCRQRCVEMMQEHISGAVVGALEKEINPKNVRQFQTFWTCRKVSKSNPQGWSMQYWIQQIGLLECLKESLMLYLNEKSQKEQERVESKYMVLPLSKILVHMSLSQLPKFDRAAKSYWTRGIQCFAEWCGEEIPREYVQLYCGYAREQLVNGRETKRTKEWKRHVQEMQHQSEPLGWEA